MHLLRGAYAQASPYLERLEGSFSSSQVGKEETEALKAEWLVMQSLLLNMQGKVTESLALATQALETAPEQDSRVRSLAYFGQAGAYQAMGDYGLGVDAYRMAIQQGRAAGNLITEMMSTSGLAQLAFEHGQLHLAFEIAAPVSARLEGSDSLPPISTVVYGMLGEVQTQWLQIGQARRNSLRALQLSVLGGYNSGRIGCRVLLSRLSQLAGDLEDAAREIQQAFDLVQVDTPDYLRQEAVAQQVHVHLARNRPAAAELALQGQGFSFQDRFSFPALSPNQSIPHSLGLLYNSSLRLLLHQARGRQDPAKLRTGIELASRLITGALQSQTLLVALEALLLRAQMHAALGNTGASQADYARALELAEPEGILGVFVEQGFPVAGALADLVRQDQLGATQARYVGRILAAFSRLQPPGTARGEQPAPDLPAGIKPVALIEPLTDRELDVLHLMAEGLKYKEIAQRLFISLNTVRSHVKAIYGKLNVNNRTQAVELARRLRIM
jgi:LuxR family maltose regulon positive regulatory protein